MAETVSAEEEANEIISICRFDGSQADRVVLTRRLSAAYARGVEDSAKVAEEMTECIRPYVNSQRDDLIPCPVAIAIRRLVPNQDPQGDDNG